MQLGHRQAVRHWILIPVCAGSNPAAPASSYPVQFCGLLELIIMGVSVLEREMVLVSGSANRPLARKISDYLDIPLADAMVSQYSDGESRVELKTNVRGKDVFIVQPTSPPVNHHIMEAVILADTCRRASASCVTLVTPYFGYARQERKSAPRTPITAKLVADMIEVSGIKRVLTLELHEAAIQGFFNIPVDHLFIKPVFAKHYTDLTNMVVISPDAGGVERARAMAKLFGCELAIMDKRRENPNDSTIMNIVGNITNKDCLIVDDICDTGGSLINATEALLKNGAKSVRAAITHAVLSGAAIKRINTSQLQELVLSDSIYQGDKIKSSKVIVTLSVAELLGKAIRRIHNSESISKLFI